MQKSAFFANPANASAPIRTVCERYMKFFCYVCSLKPLQSYVSSHS